MDVFELEGQIKIYYDKVIALRIKINQTAGLLRSVEDFIKKSNKNIKRDRDKLSNLLSSDMVDLVEFKKHRESLSNNYILKETQLIKKDEYTSQINKAELDIIKTKTAISELDIQLNKTKCVVLGFKHEKKDETIGRKNKKHNGKPDLD